MRNTAYMIVKDGFDSKVVRIQAAEHEIDDKTVFDTYGRARSELLAAMRKWTAQMRTAIDRVESTKEKDTVFAPIVEGALAGVRPEDDARLRTTLRPAARGDDGAAVDTPAPPRARPAASSAAPASGREATLRARPYKCLSCNTEGTVDGGQFTREGGVTACAQCSETNRIRWVH